jgi:hypothetical protein
MPGDASFSARRTGADRARPHRRGGHGHHPAPRASPHRLRGDVQGAGERQRARTRPAAGQPGQSRLGAAALQLQPRQPSAPRRGRGPRRGPALQASGGPDLRGSHQSRPGPRSARSRTGGPRHRAQHHHGLRLLRGRSPSIEHGARTADEVARRDRGRLTVGVDETACARASSARSAPRP